MNGFYYPSGDGVDVVCRADCRMMMGGINRWVLPSEAFALLGRLTVLAGDELADVELTATELQAARGMSASMARRCRKELVRGGWLSVTDAGRRGRLIVRRYRFELPDSQAAAWDQAVADVQVAMS